MAVPLDHFYPFGAINGDDTIVPTDDSGFAEVYLLQNFTFFNTGYNLLYVSD